MNGHNTVLYVVLHPFMCDLLFKKITDLQWRVEMRMMMIALCFQVCSHSPQAPLRGGDLSLNRKTLLQVSMCAVVSQNNHVFQIRMCCDCRLTLLGINKN